MTKAGQLGWLKAKRPNLNAKQQEVLALVVERAAWPAGGHAFRDKSFSSASQFSAYLQLEA